MRTAARYIFFVMIFALSFSIFATALPSNSSISSTQVVHAQGTQNSSSSDKDEDPTNPEFCKEMTPGIGWIACPLNAGVVLLIEGIDNLINRLLTVDPGQLFNTSDPYSSGARYKQAWSVFRSIALGIVVIAALVIIICTAFGLEILDAYTIRKLLPRTLIAILGITLSWNILEFLIILTNDVGNGVRALIYLPFQGMERVNFGDTTGIGLSLLSGGLLVALGGIGFLSLAVTAALAVIIAFLVLTLREIIIIALVLFAPIGIACLILPGTRKGWQIWQNSLTVMLVVFPIISAFIAIGRVFSLVVSNGDQGGDVVNKLIAFAAYILPYFMLPFAFRMAGGVMATLGGLTNDSSRGAFDRLKNFRANKAKKRYSDAIAGKSTLGRSPVGSLYRRVHLADQGGFSPSSRGRAKYDAARRQLAHQSSSEILKNDDGRAANNDEANLIAVNAKSGSEFLRRYKEHTGKSDEKAMEALGDLEANYGSKMGTSAMRLTAYRAMAASNTAYSESNVLTAQQKADLANDPIGRDNAVKNRIWTDAATLVNDGVTTEADVVSAMKGNKGRGDMSFVAFGDAFTQIGKSRQQIKQGQDAITGSQADGLRASALTGADGRNFMAGRHETISALAPKVISDLSTTISSGKQQDIGAALAKIANQYDSASSATPKNVDILAKEIMSKQVGPNGESVRIMIDKYRTGEGGIDNSAFLDRRREYGRGDPNDPRMGGGRGGEEG